MAKHTAVIFDAISGNITARDFWSGSIAIAQYDSIKRASASTVRINTPGGAGWTVVGTMQSVLEDFNKAAEALGLCAHIVSQNKIDNFDAHSRELIEPHTQLVPNFMHRETRILELTDQARSNIAKLRETSRTWRSEFTA